MSGEGSAEELGILQRPIQGCVEAQRGLKDPNLPLSVPTGVQLAPTSPKFMKGMFSEVRTRLWMVAPCIQWKRLTRHWKRAGPKRRKP
jgi:hypothetical protein